MVVIAVIVRVPAALCVRSRVVRVVARGVVAVSLVMVLWSFAVITAA